MNIDMINKFKERKIKAKDIFEVKTINKNTAEDIVKKYHYLGDKKFMYTVAYGLFEKESNELLGCAVFGVVGGSLALKGWFGVDNSHSNEYFELTRLVMNPNLNGCNATSYLLGNAIKHIKRDFVEIKAIISLADNSLHNGAIYQACNFKYFGLTNKKTDFCVSGSSFINQRVGTTKDKEGVWIPRSQKHRYCYIIDNTVQIKYKEERYPKGNAMNIKPNCCNGTLVVYDKRYDKYYTCPRCVGKCEELKGIDRIKAESILKSIDI